MRESKNYAHVVDGTIVGVVQTDKAPDPSQFVEITDRDFDSLDIKYDPTTQRIVKTQRKASIPEVEPEYDPDSIIGKEIKAKNKKGD